ncbi:probable DNA-directed RNA polymerase III subunit RPC5 at N-terminal half [Coccomyxa sp. Obi]|nr:probable DNA-directed RNA polymerase III subunit RPC5 at N-terminal half [Coccomyxa sp. Obi]
MDGMEPEDQVVRELDVYLSNGQLGPDTKLCLLQYPLRPPWRPYEMDYSRKVQMKPVAKRMQIDVPLHKESDNYNSLADPSLRLDSIKLSSSSVDMPTSYAVASIRGNRVVLTPVDEALALRPSLAHLAKARAELESKISAASRPDEDEKPAELQPLTVQVKRRETERQVEMRMSSYSYLQSIEAEEPWVDLAAHAPDSVPADNVWAALKLTVDADVPMTLDRQAYLDALLPGPSAAPEPPPVLDAVSPTRAAASSRARREEQLQPQPSTSGQPHAPDRPSAAAKAEPISPEARKALGDAVVAFCKHYTLFNQEQFRGFLNKQQSAARELAEHPAVQLREAIVATGIVLYCRGVFIKTVCGNAGLDALRNLIIALLQESDFLRKSDIVGAAKAGGIPFEERVYIKIMKELCTSKGGQWTIKKRAE